jgi:glycine oxidase
MERVGFDTSLTAAGAARLKQTAREILPHFAALEPVAAWAGIRPVSADLQPILGPDPAEPSLIYATGHSRNGVLMTPLTGHCIGALLAGEEPPADLTAFAPDRFSGQTIAAHELE